MINLTVKDIPEEEFSKLDRIAAARGRSVEAQVRLLIACSSEAREAAGFGSKLVAKYGGTVGQIFDFKRDETANRPPKLQIRTLPIRSHNRLRTAAHYGRKVLQSQPAYRPFAERARSGDDRTHSRDRAVVCCGCNSGQLLSLPYADTACGTTPRTSCVDAVIYLRAPLGESSSLKSALSRLFKVPKERRLSGTRLPFSLALPRSLPRSGNRFSVFRKRHRPDGKSFPPPVRRR